jgi:hypothetical protein
MRFWKNRWLLVDGGKLPVDLHKLPEPYLQESLVLSSICTWQEALHVLDMPLNIDVSVICCNKLEN